MSNPVVIVDYDLRWPAIYEEEERSILNVAGHGILAIEHIGSTAVIGLGAKPIVDIMAGVKGSSEADELLPLLREIGYQQVERQTGDSEWYYCLAKVADEKEKPRNFHLHLMKFVSETWQRHTLFRDFLRNHPATAKKYDELKRKLAAKYGVDRESYTKAKAEFITSIIAQADAESAEKIY